MMRILTFLKISLLNQRGNFMGAEGGSGGEDPTEGGNPEGGGEPQWEYPEGFDETLKGNPTLLKYADKDNGKFDYAKIMKAHVHATGMLGKDKVTLPDETWTEDQWSDLYQKLGKPESLEAFEIKAQLPEGMEENKEFASKFKEMAFQANLLPKQAEKLYSEINNYIHGSLSEVNEKQEAEYNSQVENLKKDWGEAYEQKCTRAYSALEQFADDKEIQALKEGGFIQDPVVARLFDKIADSLSEDKLNIEGAQTFGMTPAEAEEEISKMYRTDHPFMQKNHPQKAYYQEKMQKLQRIKLAGKNKR